MRFLGIGDSNDLGAMYMSLLADGHECRVFLADPEAADTLAGLIPRSADWRRDLAWIRDAGNDGVVLFETAHDGALQDALRREGYQVIGGSAYGDRLENERELGQRTMADAGMTVAPVWHFEDFEAGIAFVRAQPGRYVFKLSGPGFASYRNYVGHLEDGSDVIAYLTQQSRRLRGQPVPPFILMQHLQGVEVGVGAYFDGEGFLATVCLDWEHKRFFDGDRGELTGEMGTLVTYEHSGRLFAATLARLAEPLARSGYVGYVNINTIVDERGVWPLELTCRFGYPGFAVLSALHRVGWAEIFRRMLARDRSPFPTHNGFAVGVVLTVPPFPYAHAYDQLSKGLPLSFRADFDATDRRHLHLAEVALQDDILVTAGVVGYVAVVTGRGPTPGDAQIEAYARAAKIHVPNVRYRTDIGSRYLREDRAQLTRLGWL